MDKQTFIQVYTKIMNDIIVTDEEFQGILSTLKPQGILPRSYVPNPDLTQKNNILDGVYQKSMDYYESYLGQ